MKYDFYKPHEQVLEANEFTDPVTGEVTIMPSMTKQEFAQACDVNNILIQYKSPEMFRLMQAQAQQGTYADLPDPLDYQEALHIAAEAEKAFATLPSKVRDRFDNDPAQFLVFMENPTNEAEARELGLLKPVPVAPASDDPPSEPPAKA